MASLAIIEKEYTLINLEQGSKEWLEFRRSKIGASDIPIIMCVSPWSTPHDLWQIKTEKTPEKDFTYAMTRGVRLEPFAREVAEKHLSIPLEPAVAANKAAEWAIASLDGISIDGTIIVEIKCLGAKNHNSICETLEIPIHYQYQCQWQMYVMGASSVWFMLYSEDSHKFIEIKRDNVVIEELVYRAYEFYMMVINDIPPEISASETLYVETDATEDFKNKARNVYSSLRLLEKEWKVLRPQILDFGDGGNCESDFFVIKYPKASSRTDYKKLIRDLKISDEVLSKYTTISASGARVSIK